MSDGYFLLDALDPINQGIGGADSGFNYMQDIIVGIRPDRSGDSEWGATVVSDSRLDMTYTRKTNILTVTNMIYNAGPGDIESGMIGLRISDRTDAGAEPEYLVEPFEGLAIMYGFRGIEFEMPSLPDGQYDILPVYARSQEEDALFIPVKTPYGQTSSYSFVVSDGKIIGLRPTEDFRPVSVDMISDGPASAELSSACEYFTVTGVRAAVKEAGAPRPALPCGIYVVKTQSSTFKITVR